MDGERKGGSLKRGGNQAELIACANGFPWETRFVRPNRPKQPALTGQWAVTHCHAKAT